jgi:hypothetical protein
MRPTPDNEISCVVLFISEKKRKKKKEEKTF